ncbi:MAG: PAS domain S-box protein [Candidatus Hydrogenedentota bacterium]
MNTYVPPRISLILAVEQTALILRYVGAAILVLLFLIGHLEQDASSALIMAGVWVAHNLFSHWVFLSGRHAYFMGPFNFGLYLGEISLVTFLGGAGTAVTFTLYLLFVIGYSVHAREFYRIVGVAALCCAVYAGIVALQWRLHGLSLPPGAVFLPPSLLIISCGWLMGVISDRFRITEQEHLARAQESASSEATLRAILDSAGDSILVFDQHELITEANGRACALLQLSREKLLGSRIRGFIFDDGTLPVKFATLRNKGEYKGEQLLIDAEGNEHTTSVVIHSFVRDQHRYYVLVARDITEERRLQETERETAARLEQLNRELAQVSEVKTEFLITMSKKLRSPLAVILGYTDMLLEGELGELTLEQQKAIQTCRRNVHRVLKLLDEALELGQRQPSTIEPPRSREEH